MPKNVSFDWLYVGIQGEASRTFGHTSAFFCDYRPCKESILKKMNTDDDLNLYSMTKLPGWLRYYLGL